MNASATAVVGADGYLGAAVAAASERHGPVARVGRRAASGGFDFWRDDLQAHLDDAIGAVVFAARVHPVADADDAERMRMFAARARVLARASAGRLLVLVSTDAVFRGDRGDYREDEAPDPVSAHGRCARLLEEEVMHSAERWCIVRPSYIFGFSPAGLDRRLAAAGRAAGRGEPFEVHPDMIRSPIAVGDLARAIAEIAALEIEGVLHAGGAALDLASFFELGLAALGYPTGVLRCAPAPPGAQRDTSLRVERLLAETSVVPLDVSGALRLGRPAAAARLP